MRVVTENACLSIAVDSVILVRGLKKHLLTTFKPEEIKGVNFYAIMRAVQKS